MPLTPKENYLRMLSMELPEFVPAGFFFPHSTGFREELLTPVSAPDGPIVTTLGVEYTGSEDNMWGAMPTPGKIVIDDITKWRDKLKIKDLSDWDWESYYTELTKDLDRENLCVSVGGGDYFLTLVSLMGFDGALASLYEEPEEVKALLTHISEFYTMILKKQMYYVKPDLLGIMDDDAGWNAPFFSLDHYREFFKPFHKLHADIALDAGCKITRHDCGRSEQYVDDWLEIGIVAWNPFQVSNDCKAIKQKYVGRLALEGGWDTRPVYETDEALIEAMKDYVDTFAPGGGFTFSVFSFARPGDEEAAHRAEVIKNFYFDYVKDYYV
ncbi:MAG: hypothetical protein FWH40_08685 [Coriobacteriia bacterium]|nr:hypothetical protein [Coriobacteriia bacterium]